MRPFARLFTTAASVAMNALFGDEFAASNGAEHRTILPVMLTDASDNSSHLCQWHIGIGLRHSFRIYLYFNRSVVRTTSFSLFPSDITVGNERSMVLAATVMTHGTAFDTDCGTGPSFPPANTTVIPLATACSVPATSPYPPSDSDSTSTPSFMASSMAARTDASPHVELLSPQQAL
ncbi:Os02g0270350 [Oryza sativa Japonica Group]|uniref:Os02g0270350 protein n=1 Tax=Oryza sativa subsp. japonica TaxID=39947 RepID=A0A0P0VHF9_ORYSJ|nr:hypothetical protein EE612_010327 [Oryza sativa]BAS78050.1 Os02g0270350 [Oryza sativa Japonica Group]